VELKALYSVTDISRALHINRSTLYYKPKPPKEETVLFEAVKEAFRKGRQTYGTRRVKVELAKECMRVSRRKIAKVMRDLDLVSVYTKLKKKFTKTEVGHDDTPNIVARKFSDRLPNEVIVSDLTYFPIGNK
jgi:transposase InsO family protein